jgi:predicted RNA-binding protein associated with RNAse of E/G family
MEELRLYRKRIIPEECLELKNDIIMKRTDDLIITRWKTLKPKYNFSSGCSCYFLKKGFKVSKFYQENGEFLYWYCDIVEFTWEGTSLYVTDLLADVILYPNGVVRVVDLEELADALERNIITNQQIQTALRSLNDLLTLIYKDKFDHLSSEFNSISI